MYILFATARFTLVVLLFVMIFVLAAAPVQAGQVGTIFVCYACQNTGNSAIDAALASNPSVANDGILFAFINISAFPITGGVFSVSGTTPTDSFTMPTIAAGGTFILMPGITTDGGSHPSGGLFAHTGTTQDTSDGDGGVNDSSIFKFTGVDNGQPVTSTTFGSSTAIAGTFTPADPGLFLPYRAPVGGGSTSFVGDGPSGDPGCTNCYYGQVATLNTPTITATPEPQSFAFMGAGLVAMAWISFRRRTGSR
jgi:hypothetical protein